MNESEFEELLSAAVSRFNEQLEIGPQSKNDGILFFLARTGASFEKWLQLEFANNLQRSAQEGHPGIDVWPESQRFDLAIHEGDTLVAVIEIKHIANWWTAESSLARIDSDIDKLTNLSGSQLAYSLVFSIFAEPRIGMVPWMEKQLQSASNSSPALNSFEQAILQRFPKSKTGPRQFPGPEFSDEHWFKSLRIDTVFQRIH